MTIVDHLRKSMPSSNNEESVKTMSDSLCQVSQSNGCFMANDIKRREVYKEDSMTDHHDASL